MKVYRILLNIYLVCCFYLFIKRKKAHLVYLNSIAVRYAGLPAKLNSLPIIWHIHEHLPQGPKRWILTKYVRFIATRIIANSMMVSSMWPSPNKIPIAKTIYNGIDSKSISRSFFECNPNHFGDQDRVIGYIGQIHKIKGLETLVEAVDLIRQRFAPVKCVIVGSSTKSQREYECFLRNLIKMKHLQNCFVFLGFRKNIFPILQKMELVVLPSVSESFGRVLLEAMVMSKPVVASNVGGIPEVVVHGQTGLLVPPKDPKALAEAIFFILENHHIAIEFGEKGKKRVEEMFKFENYHEKIEKLIQELVQNRK